MTSLKGCSIVTIVLFFSGTISMPGRGYSLPRNTREVFQGGLSNPFPAKIGLRIQWWYSGCLKVPGTPLILRFLIRDFVNA